MMRQGGIRAVIVRKNGMPVGVVTDRNFAVHVAANNLSLDTRAKKCPLH